MVKFKRLISVSLAFLMLSTNSIAAFADSSSDYVYNGQFEVEDFDGSKLEIGERHSFDILVQRANEDSYETAGSDFSKEFTITASALAGNNYISNLTVTSGSSVKLSFTLKDAKSTTEQLVIIRLISRPKTSNSGYTTTINDYTIVYPVNDTGSGSGGGSSSSDTIYVSSDSYTIREDTVEKLEFDSSLRRCELDFDGYARYLLKLGNKDTYTFLFNTEGNNYVYNLNNYDDGDELYFLNFDKINSFEFEEDLYIDDRGCSNLYTVDSKGYATRVDARHRDGYFVIKSVKKFEKNYVITDKRLKLKESSKNNSSSSNKNKTEEHYISSKSYNIQANRSYDIEFSNKLFQSQLQFGKLAMYTAKLAKTNKFKIEYNTDANKYVYHVNGFSEKTPIKFINFVKSPKFEFKNTLYIRHYGCKYLYSVDNNGYAKMLSPTVVGEWFALPDIDKFENYAVTNYVLKSKNDGKTTNKSTTSNQSSTNTKKQQTETKKETPVVENKTTNTVTPSTKVTLQTSKIKSALESTAINGTATIFVGNTDVINVTELKKLMNSHKTKSIKFVHKNGDTIEYQTTLKNSQIQNISYATMVVGIDTAALDTAYLFGKTYSNKFYAVRHNNLIGSGTTANMAVRITDANIKLVKDMEQTIRVYVYNKGTGAYDLVQNSNAWIDKNNYLHFTAEIGRDYIFTSGSLQKR